MSEQNGGNPNGAKVISIETTPPKLEQLKEMVKNLAKLMLRLLSLGYRLFY